MAELSADLTAAQQLQPSPQRLTAKVLLFLAPANSPLLATLSHHQWLNGVLYTEDYKQQW